MLLKLRNINVFNTTSSLKVFFLYTFLSLFLSINIFAQEIAVKIKVISKNRISVEGNFKTESEALTKLSFLQNYADVTNLANRIENLQTFDNKGDVIEVKKINSGEYLANKKPIGWKYEVKLAPSDKLTDSAHSSWLTENRGLLMLSDLLPRFEKSTFAQVKFELPMEWKIATAETLINQNFSVKDIQNAVFLIGNNFRERTIQIDKTAINFVLADNWQFTDDEALAMTDSILSEHKSVFKEFPTTKIQIILSLFPQENSNPERWRAETRGSTVTIISGAIPFKSQAIQRLHEQLRHELFHLWIPNGLNLSGNYDWFYEGFAIYQALRTGVELNQIRFDDFLNTLSRAYQMEQMMSKTNGFSLLESSEKRWAGADNFIYAKGLAIAFMCDAAMLREKHNLKDVFRQIWNKHRFPNQIQDGNSAIVRILNSFPELRPIVQNFIEGKEKIDWKNELNSVGIEQEQTDFGIQLKVMANPNGRQKDLLDKLGYNQWRKFGQKKK
ncbi:MAG TPA: hypothetical protein PKY82_21905 [Pyrinomonadaceae bacterium]|nr:hypothetical protein [Pyrinomonadaceae bacterium]